MAGGVGTAAGMRSPRLGDINICACSLSHYERCSGLSQLHSHGHGYWSHIASHSFHNRPIVGRTAHGYGYDQLSALIIAS